MKRLFLFLLLPLSLSAQPVVPATTPWSRLFLRSTNGTMPISTVTNASWGYIDRYGSNLFQFVPIGGSTTNYFDLFIGDFTPTNSYGRPTTNSATDQAVNIGDTIFRQNQGGYLAFEFSSVTNTFWFYQQVFHVGDINGNNFQHQLFDMSANMYPSNVISDGSITLSTGTYNGNGNGVTNANGVKVMKVVSADATTTGQTLTDVTGLTNILAANATYRFKATLLCTTTAVTTGTEYGIANTGATANVGMTCFYNATGFTNAAGVGPSAVYSVGATNSATPAFLQGSGQTGVVVLEGFITTQGGPPTMAVRHLKVTSGTSTVKVGSTLEIVRTDIQN